MDPHKFSELKDKYETNEEMAEALRLGMNNLASFNIKEYKKSLKKKEE